MIDSRVGARSSESASTAADIFVTRDIGVRQGVYDKKRRGFDEFTGELFYREIESHKCWMMA